MVLLAVTVTVGLPAKSAESASDWFTAKGTESYSAFNQPSAQCRDGRTFIAFPDQNFDPAMVCYDHASRAWSGPVRVGANPLSPQRDSHGNPALLIDRKGNLHVFYGCHVGPLKYARSAKPGDISSWKPMPDPAPHATYPQVMQLSDGTIQLFYRSGGHCADWECRTSGDGGDTWSPATAIVRGIPPQVAWYVSFVKGPNDTVHAGFVYKDDNNAAKAPGPEFTHRYDAFHMQKDRDGTWRNAAGAKLALPLSRADANSLCKVHDSFSQKQFTGACSIAVDPAGAPYLLFRLGDPHGNTIYHHKLARRKAGKWEITDVGPAIDAGFADYPRDDNFTLSVLSPTHLRAYLANIMAGAPVRTELDQWDSQDSGATWVRTKTLFSSTEYPAKYVLISPKPVADPHPDGRLVFGETKRYLWGDSGYVKRTGADR